MDPRPLPSRPLPIAPVSVQNSSILSKQIANILLAPGEEKAAILCRRTAEVAGPINPGDDGDGPGLARLRGYARRRTLGKNAVRCRYDLAVHLMYDA